ncbi:hypothetical protein OIU85_022700 [Salix viminalis]|uniref:Uncharacterized protein n=1 Tax=Salix viminalis TaxID=40686 RepID=A0A9Q0U7D8_SALVM|nr:hypothetical protein OIU85_022700 [Salix viminalis]
MAEELHESEVIFSDDEHECREYYFKEMAGVFSSNNKKVKTKKQNQSSSVPVIIPSRVYQLSDSDDFRGRFCRRGSCSAACYSGEKNRRQDGILCLYWKWEDVERERPERS